MPTKLRVCSAWRGNGDCLACDGQENSFFSGLAPEIKAQLHVDVSNMEIAPSELLYQTNTKAESVWVLRTGAVKLLATAWDGSQRIVRVLKVGDVAGLEGLLAGSFAHTAVTVGNVRACRMPLPAIEELCLKNSGFQWNLMKKLQFALRETEQWLVDLASTGVSARVRMARLLLLLRDGRSNRIYNFSREELGLMLGITIETASRIIAAFLRENILMKSPQGHRFYDADISALEKAAHGN